MKRLFSLLLLAFFCCACSRGKYYISNIFREGGVGNMATMVLDSSYHFYLREVYKDKNMQQENVLKSNVEKSNTANKTRIEVEYLLLSGVHKSAIYISTVPDKYQNYYSTNRFADTLINAYDFSTFHFGQIAEDGESITFVSRDGEKAITWDIRPFINGHIPTKLFIREIVIQRKDNVENVILINRSLEEPLSFSLQNSFTIIFERPGGKPDSLKYDSALCRLLDQKIYFSPVKDGFDLFFRFDKKLSESGDSVIRFDYRRTRYTPVEPQR